MKIIPVKPSPARLSWGAILRGIVWTLAAVGSVLLIVRGLWPGVASLVVSLGAWQQLEALTIGGLSRAGLRAGAILGLAAGLLVLSRWAGGAALTAIGFRTAGPSAAFAVLTGYGVLSLLVFGVTATGLCRPDVIVATGLAGMMLATLRQRRACTDLGVRVGGWTRASPGAALAAGALALLALPRFLLPEFHADCLQYHLLYPQQLLMRHRFPEPPVYESWGYPLFAELPNVLPVALHLDLAVKVVMAALGWLPVAALIRHVVPGLGFAAAAGLGALALILPTHVWVIGTAKNDLASLGFAVGAVLAVLQAPASAARPQTGRSLVAGFLLGCTVASKPALLPFAGCVGAWGMLRMRSGRAPVRPLVALAAALVPVAPWSVKIFMHSVTPLYAFGTLGASGGVRLPTVAVTAGLLEALAIWRRDAPLAPLLLAWWVANRGMPLRAVAGVAVASTLAMTLAWPGSHTHIDRYAYAGSVLLNVLGLAAVGRVFAQGGGLSSPGRGAGALRRAACWAAVVAVGLPLYTRGTLHQAWVDDGAPRRALRCLTGSLAPEAYRASMIGAWGDLLPDIRRISGGRLLSTGGIMFWDTPVPLVFSCEPAPFVRTAVAASPSTARLAVRFRQLDIRRVVENSDAAAWGRSTAPDGCWTPAMILRYADFLKFRSAREALAPCRTPGWGLCWLLRIDPRPAATARPVDVMPGFIEAFGTATRLMVAGDLPAADAAFRTIWLLVPDVPAAMSAYGYFLMQANRQRDALPLVRAAALRGYASCIEQNFLQWTIAALNAGRAAEAEDAYRRTVAVHDLAPPPALKRGR